MWKALADSPKRQHLITLQRKIDDTAYRMSVCAPIIATPSLLKMVLALEFHLDHRDNLGTGLHQFCLIQHISVAWKVLKAGVDQHQVITGGGGAPTLAEAFYLTLPNGVSLTEMVAMTQSSHACLLVVLDTLIGRYYPTSQGMDTVVLEMIEREM